MDAKNTLRKSSRFVNRFDAGPFDVPLFEQCARPTNTNLGPALVCMIGVAVLLVIVLKIAQ